MKSLLERTFFIAALSFASYAATPTDLRLKEQIESNLLVDERVNSDGLRVEVETRVATLRGQVGHLPAKRAAALIAASTPGIRDVKNVISIRPAGRTDSEIRKDVVDALSEDPSTDFYEIHVDVEDGTVHLTGIVDSYTEKKMAEEAAVGVSGVTAVRNAIVVEVPDWRSDYEIEKDVERRIRSDLRLRDFPIRVDVDQGVVHLSGAVETPAQRYWARTLGWAAGAREVEASRIEVRDGNEEPTQGEQQPSRSESSATRRTDSELRTAVIDALALQPTFKKSPSVTVANGKVTLMGTIQTLAAKRLAEAVASDVAGVKSVSNDLIFETTVKVSNEILSDRVQRAINRDSYLSDDSIRARVDRGEAMLVGWVDSEFERQRLERIVGRVFGVRSIKNATRAAAFEN